MGKPLLKMVTFGIDTGHDPRFVVDRPNGYNGYLVMCFRTGFVAQTASGIMTGFPGDCLILDPKFPEWLGTPPGQKEGFRNDWMILTGTKVGTLLRKKELPINRIISTGEGTLMLPFLLQIQRRVQTSEGSQKLTIEDLLEKFFEKLAQSRCCGSFQNLSQSAKDRYQAFLGLRVELHQNFKYRWTIREMAKKMHLSPSRFCVLYHDFFKRSPMDDIIQYRLKHAQWLLRSSNMSIQSVAEESGFSSVYYFSRLFKKKLKTTPSAYAKQKNEKILLE